MESFADQQPWITQLYHRESGKLLRVGVSHPSIQAKQMGQTDFIRYKARDGLDIPAYITLPAGGAKKHLPLVVLVHGGPFVRGFSWRWDAEVQFLASRGYAVLQPEFRGSTGFGAKHFEAGWRQWGQAMQTDVADGTRWAIAQGIADPNRICIAGASYGGYATLMGLIQNPELFRCGINWVGVTDLNLLLTVQWSDMFDEYRRYGAPRLIGDPVADAAMFKAASPLQNAARITQPLLMAYGAKDRRVPLVHGEKFRDAVLPHNKQVQWVVYPEEGHGWSKAETRIDFWGRVEKFLARNLVP
ncbi:MAG: S9 family peptidase [Ideonella sp.]|nr:S9 family peptidase [Ideonella sp.]